jgi:hypothetical protein
MTKILLFTGVILGVVPVKGWSEISWWEAHPDPAQWEQAGAHDLRTVARQRTLDLLATYFPRHLDSATEAVLRAGWDIKLMPQEMHAL